MIIKRILSAAIATAILGVTFTSCSRPNLENLLSFNEVKVSKYSSVVADSALTFYVDANVESGGDGSDSAPFKTISEAQAEIREIKNREGLPVGGITVIVKDGEYRIAEGLVFTEEDSGTEVSPITYVSESEFGARITGSRLLFSEDFEPINEEEISRLMDRSAAEHIVKIDLTKYGLTADDWGEYVVTGSHHTGHFYKEYADAYESVEPYSEGSYIDVPVPAEAEVFVGERVLHCARYPNDEYIPMKDVVDRGDNPVYGDISADDPIGPTVSFDMSFVDRIKGWSTLDDIWAFGYISITWADSRNKVESFDLENGTVQFRYAETHLNSSEGRRWYFFNIFDELDAEGEYYLDREKGVLYIYKTPDMETENIKISVLADDIITLDNLSYVTFKGFDLSETRGSGIYGTAKNVTVDNCKVYNIRGGGIKIYGNDLNVSNCELASLGTYGIYLNGGDLETLTPSGNIVYNNYIHDWARVVTTYRTGIQVEGVGSIVSNNELCNSPHQAITWHGPYHIFEYNEVYNVLTETADCGAFYSGKNLWSYGCEIRYNFIHDIGSEGNMACGIYWDDGLSGQKAYGNLLANIAGHGFSVGGGRDCFIENNVLMNVGMNPIRYDQRQRQWVMNYDGAWFSYTATLADEFRPYLENSVWMEAFPEYNGLILYTDDYNGDLDDRMLSSNPANGAIRNNVYYEELSQYGIVTDLARHEFDSDVGKFSIISNNPIIFNDFSDFPQLNNDSYYMKENSKAKKLCPDFEPIPFDKIGRIK